jgi:hypothetical protein
MLRNFTLLALVATCAAWSRLNVKTPDGDFVTCGGGIFDGVDGQVAKNMRGENPDVPVSLIARYPFLSPLTWWLSEIHVLSAIVILVVVWINLIMPKGTDPNYKPYHMAIGRIVVWGILPHYYIIAFWLNYRAILQPTEHWKLSPPASDWRLQVSYIVPFGVCTMVSTIIAFGINRYSFFPPQTAKVCRYLSYFSMAFWLTIGVYQTGAQAAGIGLGNFGIWDVPGYGKTQAFWQPINIIVFLAGMTQCGLDFGNSMVLKVIETSGNDKMAWKDQHKWGIFVLSYQCTLIFGLFVAYFPYCLYGFPEWTCIKTPFLAGPFIGFFMTPVLQFVPWLITFGKSMFGIGGSKSLL